LLDPSYAKKPASPADSDIDQFEQQLTVSSSDPTTVVSNDSSTTSTAAPVKGKGGHHHHHSSGSGQVDNQNILDQLSQAFGEDEANDVTSQDGSVDLSKVASLLGTKSQSQLSSLGTTPLISITA